MHSLKPDFSLIGSWLPSFFQDEKLDGTALDKKFQDQSKVPLFYSKDLQKADASLRLFFSRKDLLTTWRQEKQSPDQSPSIQVVDLLGIFESILRDRVDMLPSRDLIFVPDAESVELARDLQSKGCPAYNANRMII